MVNGSWGAFTKACAEKEKPIPGYVCDEVKEFLRCGDLRCGFTRRKCEECQAEHFLPFSCKKRSFCPSCMARRATETMVHLSDHVLPLHPLRQWVFTLPVPLRYMMARSQSFHNDIHSLIVKAMEGYYISIAEQMGIKAATRQLWVAVDPESLPGHSSEFSS